MADPKDPRAVEKLETGIEGFDLISNGGLPKGRTTMVAGTAGSAKTIFATQFLVEGITRSRENGAFVTFEETAEDIRQNMLGFGWDIRQWEAEDRWAFVDASPQPGQETIFSGHYDLSALISRIEHGVKRVGAKRVSLDSLGAIFAQFSDSATIRGELFKIGAALKRMGVTAVVTAERTQEYGEISRHGVEEFVADNVIVLRNVLEAEKRRRTLEILKYRGASHQKGEFPFTVMPGVGIIAIPLSALEFTQRSSDARVTSGCGELDEMCGGGFFRDSLILVSGATGCGKTLMATNFIAGGAEDGERCLLFSFEESDEHLFRNAAGWGLDFPRMEREGKLKVICQYPEVASLEDHLIRMKEAIGEFKPNRMAVDSLSALERVATDKRFREFVIALTSFIKERDIAGLFTATTSGLTGGTSAVETSVATITDAIILLRYVEIYGEMRRGIAVLKMRGSPHDKEIREFAIDQQGMHIGNPFRNVSGILAGNPVQIAASELERVGELFQDEGESRD